MTEFINVPVPADRVLEVYALLAQPPAAAPDDNETGVDWDVELIRRAYTESSPAMRLLFDYLRTHVGRPVPAEELADAIGQTRQQLNGVLGAFGRRVKNHYKRTTWPFAAIESRDLSMFTYEMSQDMAVMFQDVN